MAGCRINVNPDTEHLYTDEQRYRRYEFHVIDERGAEIKNQNGISSL